MLVIAADRRDELLEENGRVAPIDPRTVAVRYSNLKHMGSSPAHYLHAVQVGREDSIAMRVGRGAHAVAFGLPVVQFTGKVRSGKAWEAFRAEHEGKAEILNVKEWDQAHRMGDALRSDPIAGPLLFGPDVVHEQQIEWSYAGKKCTSRPDARCGSGYIVDLKTTQSSEPARFERDAWFRGYNGQLAFYDEAQRFVDGAADRDLYVVAIESKPPHVVTTLQLTANAIDQGTKLWRMWFERLLVCEASNHWPGYADSIVKLDAPGDADFKVVIDGEEVGFDV